VSNDNRFQHRFLAALQGGNEEMLKEKFAILRLKKAGDSHVGWSGSKIPWTFVMLDKQEVRHDLLSAYLKIRHPAFPRILDVKEGDTYYCVLKENIHGEHLESRLSREGRLDHRQASGIIEEVCEALEFLRGLRPGIVCYRDVALSDMVLDHQGKVKLINLEKLILRKDHAAGEATGDVQQVQSVALLYYNLLTGINPCDMDGHIPSFSQLGLYLPGELFDLIARTLKPGSPIKTLGQFRKEVEKLFPRRCEESGENKTETKRRMTGRQALAIAAATLALSAATVVGIRLWALNTAYTTENMESKMLLAYGEAIPPAEKTENTAYAYGKQETLIPGDTASDVETPVTRTETEDGATQETGDIADPEETADTAKSAPTKTDRNTPAAKREKVYLSSLKPTSFTAGNDSFKLAKLDASDRDIHGGSYQTGIKLELVDSYLSDYKDQWMTVEYDLDKGYSRLSCVFSVSQAYKHIDPCQKAWLNILGDGKLILSTASVGSSSGPVRIEADIRGVRKLTLQLNPASQFVENVCYIIGDPLLEP